MFSFQNVSGTLSLPLYFQHQYPAQFLITSYLNTTHCSGVGKPSVRAKSNLQAKNGFYIFKSVGAGKGGLKKLFRHVRIIGNSLLGAMNKSFTGIATSTHLTTICGCFHTTTAELGRFIREHMAHGNRKCLFSGPSQ